MKFNRIKDCLKGIPHMSADQGRLLYDFIIKSRIQNVLELGFAHGVSSCYIAAALDELGSGCLTTIDLKIAMNRNPNIDSLLEKTGLQKYVNPMIVDRSYNWELMRIIENQTVNNHCSPLFDFCFIDGAHTWADDGFAFMLVDKLLKEGGWILFDDIEWSISKSPTLSGSAYYNKLPEEERNTPQIRRVFELLVKQHPNYIDCCLSGNWGWARKTKSGDDEL